MASNAAWEVSPDLPRTLQGVLSLHDFEQAARRVLPRCIFGYIVGGVEDENSLRANRAVFNEWALRPRILIDTSRRTTAKQLFGHDYAAPFGIPPMGGAALVNFNADLAIAAAAAEKNVPYVLSGASLMPLERVISANRNAWFQTYLPPDRSQIPLLLERVARAGYDTLVATVDVPVPGNRENNMRTGFTSPLRPSLRLMFDGVSHPRWLLGTAFRTLMREGMPHFENYGPQRGAPLLTSKGTIDVVRDGHSWKDFEDVRRLWKGKLIIKGVLAPEDARMAREAGADGIVVSNHGARQIDGIMTSLQALPEVVAEAGKITVMFDGGVRRGSDVLKALALGADFVFVGRPFLYAAATAGQAGVARAIDLLCAEIERNLAMLGCVDYSSLKSLLVKQDASLAAPRQQ